MMEAYTEFAEVYDEFMENIPYDEWCYYLKKLLEQYGVSRGMVLELGCGTGNVSERLAEQGYEMIGIDQSEDMLAKAMKKQMEKESKTLYLLQDIREFELYGTVAAVISVCDTMNYILEEEEMIQVFRGVNNYLDPNGIFIFDLKTEYYFKDIMGDCTLAENGESASYIWENYYYEEEEINEYQLTIFKKVMDSSYEKYEEQHFQRAYSLEHIISLLEQAGMEYVTAYDAFTENPPSKTSERIYVVAKEKPQEGKFYV